MNVSLGDRWETFVFNIVKRGRYGSASESCARACVWSKNARKN